MMEKKYNYFYKITNLLNGHFYYGIHSTDNLEDEYMGSGHRLHDAYKKYGIENFNKEILYFFKTRKEASDYEMEVVNENLVKDEKCYNLVRGGEDLNTIGQTQCFDKQENKNVVIFLSEYYKNRDRYVNTSSDSITARKRGTNEWKRIPLCEYSKEEYETPTSFKVVCKDKEGNIFLVDKNDYRIDSKEYKPLWSDRKHSEESLKKMKESFLKTKHQQGEKNSQYGTCWIYRENKCIKINKDKIEKYLSDGWIKGRKINKTIVYKNAKINNINLNELKNDYENGMTLKDLGKKYGITYSYVCKILDRKKLR